MSTTPSKFFGFYEIIKEVYVSTRSLNHAFWQFDISNIKEKNPLKCRLTRPEKRNVRSLFVCRRMDTFYLMKGIIRKKKTTHEKKVHKRITLH